jgi:small subunit ribosomal protein S6e
MAKFKVIVSDPSTSKSKVVELEGARAVPLIGRRLGETIDGSVLGMSGTKLQLTGGSDKDGFPMRLNVHGGVRVSIIVSKSVGFHPKREGERQRKTIRGNVITEEIVQINMKVSEKAKKTEKPKREKKVKAESKIDQEAAAEPKPPEEPDKAGKGEAQHVAVKSGGGSSEEIAQTAGG